MHIDNQARTITFRILYHGPGGATKLLNLRGLQSCGQKEQGLAILHAGDDRVATVPVSCEGEPPVMGLDIAFQAVAVAGVPSSRAVERLLVATADAVVVLPDRAKPGGKDTRRSLARLSEYLGESGINPGDMPIFVQDYADGNPRLEPRQMDSRTLSHEPTFVPVAGDTTETTHEVFKSARDAILDRMRRLATELGDEAAHQALMSRAMKCSQPAGRSSVRWLGRWGRAALCTIIGAAAAAAFVAWIA